MLSKYELLKNELKALTNSDQLINIQRSKELMKLIQYEQTHSMNTHKVRRYDKADRLVDLDKNRSNFNQPYAVRYSKQLLNVLLGSNDQK